MKLAEARTTCHACGGCHGFEIVKLPGGGPWAAVCKGCGRHNDPEELGYQLSEIVSVGPYEERFMAKQKEKSRAEILAEQLKNGGAKRETRRQIPSTFPENKLKAKRTALDLKQAVVARECVLEAGSLSAIEKGGDPRLSSAMRLAKFYGLTVEQLFGDPVLDLKFETLTVLSPADGEVARNATEPETDPLPFPDPEEVE